ncbi:hypothetical protein GW17_00048003 [Ensete ventricosum]|nr:hypothetical protein GW17_00048003 [Ensete ventricosum]
MRYEIRSRSTYYLTPPQRGSRLALAELDLRSPGGGRVERQEGRERERQRREAMAYRRKQPVARVSTYEDSRSTGGEDASSTSSTPGSLAARAIRASAAHRDVSSLSSAYGESAVSSPRRESNPLRSSASPQQSLNFQFVAVNPYRPVHTGPAVDWYADRPLPGGTAKIGRQRSISAVDDRFPPSTVDFRRRWSISTVYGRFKEKSTVDGRLRKKKERRRGKEEEEEEEKYLAPPQRRLHPGVAREPSLPALP